MKQVACYLFSKKKKGRRNTLILSQHGGANSGRMSCTCSRVRSLQVHAHYSYRNIEYFHGAQVASAVNRTRRYATSANSCTPATAQSLIKSANKDSNGSSAPMSALGIHRTLIDNIALFRFCGKLTHLDMALGNNVPSSI